MEDLKILDLIILEKIHDNDTSVESFGPLINTSFFESANILGTLKVKGLITFEQSIGGKSKLDLTDKGQLVLTMAEEKAKNRLDQLDQRILQLVSKGKTDSENIYSEITVIPEAITFHIHKLVKKGYINYYTRSSRVYLLLTEKGFNHVQRLKGREEHEQSKHGDKETALSESPENEEPAVIEAEVSSHPIPIDIEDEPNHQEEPSKEEIKRRRFWSKVEYYFNRYKWFIIGGIILILLIILVLTGTIVI